MHLKLDGVAVEGRLVDGHQGARVNDAHTRMSQTQERWHLPAVRWTTSGKERHTTSCRTKKRRARKNGERERERERERESQLEMEHTHTHAHKHN